MIGRGGRPGPEMRHLPRATGRPRAAALERRTRYNRDMVWQTGCGDASERDFESDSLVSLSQEYGAMPSRISTLYILGKGTRAEQSNGHQSRAFHLSRIHYTRCLRVRVSCMAEPIARH
jgi:hypothetical protein